jgi:hypothetical protein
MAKNPPYGDNRRQGQVTDRSQTYNPYNDRWVKRDTDTGRFIVKLQFRKRSVAELVS